MLKKWFWLSTFAAVQIIKTLECQTEPCARRIKGSEKQYMKIQVYVSTKAQVPLRMNTYLEKLSFMLRPIIKKEIII